MRATVCQDSPGWISDRRNPEALLAPFPHKLCSQRPSECLDALLQSPGLPGWALESGRASLWLESVVGGEKRGADKGEGSGEKGGRKGKRKGVRGRRGRGQGYQIKYRTFS